MSDEKLINLPFEIRSGEFQLEPKVSKDLAKKSCFSFCKSPEITP